MDLSLAHIILLFVAAIWAGALNAIAGGGTFFTFPVLLLVGIPPIIANTTNKFALSFASIAGVVGFWKEIRAIRSKLLFFCSLGIIGSITGSIALLLTSAAQFEAMIPWLMLAATLLFALGNKVVGWLGSLSMRAEMIESRVESRESSKMSLREDEAVEAIQHQSKKTHNTQVFSKPYTSSLDSRLSTLTTSFFIGFAQFLIGIYGGFFAAGMGILMMALYELAGMKNIHEMNALKSAVGLGINVVSAITFLMVGIINWHIALILVAGALIGGYSGAILSKRLSPAIIRGFIVCYGTAMTVYFFVK